MLYALIILLVAVQSYAVVPIDPSVYEINPSTYLETFDSGGACPHPIAKQMMLGINSKRAEFGRIPLRIVPGVTKASNIHADSCWSYQSNEFLLSNSSWFQQLVNVLLKDYFKGTKNDLEEQEWCGSLTSTATTLAQKRYEIGTKIMTEPCDNAFWNLWIETFTPGGTSNFQKQFVFGSGPADLFDFFSVGEYLVESNLADNLKFAKESNRVIGLTFVDERATDNFAVTMPPKENYSACSSSVTHSGADMNWISLALLSSNEAIVSGDIWDQDCDLQEDGIEACCGGWITPNGELREKFTFDSNFDNQPNYFPQGFWPKF